MTAVMALALIGLAERERSPPSFCGPGLITLGAHCCGEGQTLRDDHCAGVPLSCPPHMHIATGSNPGCVALNHRTVFGGGRPGIPPPSWSLARVVPPAREPAGPFVLDSTEVTWARYDECVQKQECPGKPGRHEPGLPVTGVNAKQAEAYCQFSGGRLPTGTEWLLAAAGAQGRRFPWGNTGLVCRRSAFGMVSGPCAEDGGPTLAGARPDSATPDGVLDLSGNVAEWTREPGDSVIARGGSFRSKVAGALETSAVENKQPFAAAAGTPYIGFRCAYDHVPR